jgi:hypothetical protein
MGVVKTTLEIPDELFREMKGPAGYREESERIDAQDWAR